MATSTMNEEQTEVYNEWLKQLGIVVSNRRKELGLTQDKMAYKIGINFKQYQDIEYGRRPITTRTLFVVANGLELDPTEMVNRVK